MSIETKIIFLSEFERELTKKTICPDTSAIMSVMSYVLADYDLTRHKRDCSTDDLLEIYLSALQVEGKSSLTVERYRYILSRMKTNIEAPTRDITIYHLRRYLSDEKKRGISDRTLEGTRQVMSAYFNWLQRERLIDENPCANLGVIKYPKKQKDIYTDVDLEQLKFGCRTSRDRAIVYFLKATGCRISEMTQLNRDDVNLNTLECTVFGKGSKERIVFLDDVSGMVLKSYLDERTDDLPALFIGRGSERIKPAAVRKMLNQLGEDSNVNHVHPHKFRRTAATNLIRHGMPIQEVAAILGHDKLDTTMQYVVLDKTDVKNSYRKYSS